MKSLRSSSVLAALFASIRSVPLTSVTLLLSLSPLLGVPTSGRIPIEAAQREFQVRSQFLNFGTVQWPACSCSLAPAYPKDGFYGDLRENPTLAVTLVRHLISQFNDSEIYASFIRSSDGSENLEGIFYPEQGRPAFEGYFVGDGYVPDLDPWTTTETNYEERFNLIFTFLKKLRCVSSGVGYQPIDAIGDYLESRSTLFYSASTDAHAICEQDYASSGWAFDYSGSRTIQVWSQEYQGDGPIYEAQFGAERGRVYANFTCANYDWSVLGGYKGTARIYLVATNQPGGPNASTSPPVANDSCWHAFGAPTLGGTFFSGPLANFSGPVWNGYEDYVWPGAIRGWQLINANAAICVNFTHAADPDECGGCAGKCALGDLSAENQGAYLRVGLGIDSTGQSSGYLVMNHLTGGPNLYTPAGLRFVPGPNTQSSLPEITLTQGGVEVAASGPTSYTITFFTPANWLSRTAWFKRIIVEQINGSTNQVRISETDGSATVVKAQFVYDPALASWELVYGSRKETRASTVSGNDRTETYRVYDVIAGQPDKLVFQEVSVYRTFAWGEELVQRTLGETPNTLTENWDYGTTTGQNSYSRLIEHRGPTGAWERFAYDACGRETLHRKGWQDAAPADDDSLSETFVTEYSSFAPHVKITHKIQGQEIGRRELIYSENEVEERVYPAPGDSTYLKTVTALHPYYYGASVEEGRIKSVLRPDGTMDFHQYYGSQDISASGEPNAGRTAIKNGTKTVVSRNSMGQVTSVTTWAVDNESDTVVLSYETNDDPDSLGRLQRTQDQLSGGITTHTYGCCGVMTETNREGLLTSFDYDDQGRRSLQSRNDITSRNYFNARNQLLESTRQGSTGPAISLTRTGYDPAGRVTAQTNAMGAVTSISEALVNNKLVRTTTNPDLGTRIETYYRDGRLEKTTGTAVFGTRYDYGRAQDGSSWRAFVRQTKLDATGAETAEWTETWNDGAEQTIRTIFPGSAIAYSWFNGNGQLWRQRDPDGVTTYFTYNALGEQEYVVHAVSQSSTNYTDYATFLSSLSSLKAGVDRITQTVRTIQPADTQKPDRNRIDTVVWDQNNSSASKVVSRIETSMDGLSTWQTVWGIAGNDATKLVTESVTVLDRANHRRTITVTATDGTQSVSLYQDGRLQSVTRKDATAQHNQVSLISYGYDAHGRQNTVTDASTDTTTMGYNDADLVETVTTPVPGPGQSEQVTHTYYNEMLQVTNIVQPDNTSLYTIYYPNGLRKRTYGSREFPVEYSYDYAGRVQTMTTWQNYPNQPAVATWNYSSSRGWLDNKRYPDAGSGSLGPDYLYTAAGKLRERTWARGNPRLATTYSYSIAGDLETIDYADSTADVTYAFDRRGRQSSVSQSGSASASWTYNDLGNVLSETNSTGLLSGLSVTNGYDHHLRRTNVVLLGSGSSVLASTTNSFDTAGRMKVVGSGAASITYSYLANSPLVEQISFANNGAAVMNSVKSYDALNRLTNIVSSTNGVALIKHSYLYNAANQRTRATLVDNSYWVYSYDSLGQVTSGRKYWSDGTPVAGQQFDYSFDTIGNRKTSSSGGDELGTSLKKSDYFVSALNQYTNRSVPGFINVIGTANSSATVSLWGENGSFSPTTRKGEYFRGELSANNNTGAVWLTITNVAVLKSGNTDMITNTIGNSFLAKTPQAFYHDLDGNLTNDGHWIYTWDAENRLTRMVANNSTGPQQRIDFDYDWQGRRITKKVWNNTNGTGPLVADRKFIYDGWNLLAELNATNNLVIRSYIWGLDLSGTLQGAGGVGGLLAVYDTSTINSQPSTHFTCFDGNGNVMALVNAVGGTLTAQYEFGPFGEVLRATGPMATANPFRFSTKFQDDESDLLYYGRRYYSFAKGGWLSRDPIEENGGPNLYGFVLGNPINRFDALGESSSCCQCGDDVTSLVYQTKSDIASKFAAASVASKMKACMMMFSYTQGFSSWDINWLKNYAHPVNPKGCKCKHTVTLEGKCVNANELNYLMYGWAMALCNEPRYDLDALRRALSLRGNDRDDAIARKVNFAQYGFDPNNSDLVPMSRWPEVCQPSKKKGHANISQWTWRGLQDETK